MLEHVKPRPKGQRTRAAILAEAARLAIGRRTRRAHHRRSRPSDRDEQERSVRPLRFEGGPAIGDHRDRRERHSLPRCSCPPSPHRQGLPPPVCRLRCVSVSHRAAGVPRWMLLRSWRPPRSATQEGAVRDAVAAQQRDWIEHSGTACPQGDGRRRTRCPASMRPSSAFELNAVVVSAAVDVHPSRGSGGVRARAVLRCARACSRRRTLAERGLRAGARRGEVHAAVDDLDVRARDEVGVASSAGRCASRWVPSLPSIWYRSIGPPPK